MGSRILVGLVFLLAASFASPALHHYATSLAEADYNTETKSLEVALSLQSSDLEWVLSRRAEKRVSLETTPKVDLLIEAYIKEVLAAKLADGTAASFTWIGKEMEPGVVWIFFELGLPDGLAGVELTNRTFIKWERDQINTVNLRADGRSRTLTFDRRHPSQLLVPGSGDDKD